MILVQATSILLALIGSGPPTTGPDSTAVARRIAASAELAAQEYRLGVDNGRVTAQAEVDEARLFLGEARRTAALLPAGVADAAITELDLALGFVDRVGSPDSLDAAVGRLTHRLTTALGVVLVEIPEQSPSLVRGEQIYRRDCANCHGRTGAGDGGAAAAMNPPPSNLTDHVALADATPLSFYQRITIGVAGTAMPAYESRYDPADRWAVALYASTLRQAQASGSVPPALQSFPNTAELSDAQVLAALGDSATREQLAAVRSWQDPVLDGDRNTAVFAAVRSKIDNATTLAKQGEHDAAVAAAFDAYLAFEGVERTVRAKEPGLATELEASFAALRNRAAGGATAEELSGVQAELLSGLERAERVVGDRLSNANLFVQSLVIMIREGLEAILIIGALMAFLVRIGAGHRRRDIHIGVGAAVALSLLTAVLLETVFQISPVQRETLEGFTVLAAVGVLFYVSYWLLSKMEVQKWTAFVKDRVSVAVSGGSAFALASAAFLAVYREGFETVLFYKALLVSGGPATGGTFAPVASGIAVGAAILAIVYVAINKYGVRLPLKPFFGVTSAFLYYTAFVFAGKGIAELQEGGVVGTTVLQGWPRLPALGIYPTVESMLAQGLLLALAVFALVWLRMKARQAKGEERGAVPVAPMPEPLETTTAAGMEETVLRSLEQMEADLAALKGEVERLRATVVEESAERVANS